MPELIGLMYLEVNFLSSIEVYKSKVRRVKVIHKILVQAMDLMLSLPRHNLYITRFAFIWI